MDARVRAVVRKMRGRIQGKNNGGEVMSLQRINMLFMEGYRAAIRMLIEQAEGMAKDKKAKVVAKNTIQWLKLCHENANELADGNRPSLWITPEGKLFFKKER